MPALGLDGLGPCGSGIGPGGSRPLSGAEDLGEEVVQQRGGVAAAVAGGIAIGLPVGPSEECPIGLGERGGAFFIFLESPVGGGVELGLGLHAEKLAQPGEDGMLGCGNFFASQLQFLVPLGTYRGIFFSYLI